MWIMLLLSTSIYKYGQSVRMVREIAFNWCFIGYKPANTQSHALSTRGLVNGSVRDNHYVLFMRTQPSVWASVCFVCESELVQYVCGKIHSLRKPKPRGDHQNNTCRARSSNEKKNQLLASTTRAILNWQTKSCGMWPRLFGSLSLSLVFGKRMRRARA